MRGGRRGAWLLVLVLPLALVLPCAHATAQAAPLAPVAGAGGGGVGGGGAGEYDQLGTAPRAPARSVRRGAVLRAVSPGRTTGPRERRSVAPPLPGGPPSSPRSVVLRC
ncbi:hypothetical protein FM21_29360 [Streptomyces mutabilis]|uniref:Secreted protein n=1 Tax=Streptomyces mutabilis TaxID=67332 RepID=A0A086MTP8_9ACTN|nr:hypothetical protein FM21_29360 [Streptomyces mutabilis]